MLHWSEHLTVEEIEEMLRVATEEEFEETLCVAKDKDKDSDSDSISICTSTNTNHIDCDETRSDMDDAAVMNNATGSEDGGEAWLTTTNGKLQTFEPETERIYPMDTMPEKIKEFKQWLKDECRSLEKKCEWIRWIMDLPLDPSEFEGACMTPFNDLEGPEELNAAVKRCVGDMYAMHTDMESAKKDRDEKLEAALAWDFTYRSAKKDVEWCTMVIKKSLEKDGESLSQV